MRITSRKTVFAGLALAGTSALLLAGCAAAPDSSEGDETAAPDFVPCMVSDSGGFDDKSFNQLGKEGLDDAAAKLGVEPIAIQSDDEAAYAPNIDNLVSQNCNLIVTVGFLLSDATLKAAAANPDIDFAIIDDGLDADADGKVDVDNGKPIVFDTAQAAFLAGYAAASYSKSGIVGTFGGIQIPPVTIFMDGFVDGVKYFNDQKGKNVQVLGWDVAAQTGAFTGGFAAGTEALNAANALIEQGADVILPVGGPIFLSAGEAIRTSGKDIALVGVDADVYNTSPDLKDLFLTSIMKGVKAGVADVVAGAATGDFDNTPFIGTLENDGVGLAPFHDFESKVSSDLKGELDTIKAGIIDGSIKVESPATPKA